MPGLTRAKILNTALSVIDELGADSLTVRSITQRLGVHPGALYHHFRDMDSIREEVVFTVVSEAVSERRVATSWRTATTERARSFRASVLRHPNVLPLLVGESGLRVWGQRLFTGLGEDLEWFLDLLEADDIRGNSALLVLETVEAFVIGSVTVAVAARKTATLATGQFPPRLRTALSTGLPGSDTHFELSLAAVLDACSTGFVP